MLECIVDSAWAEWDRARRDPYDRVCVPEQSAPLLWFGDLNAYGKSPRRILTLGVNPGPSTFPQHDPWVNCPLFAPEASRRSAATMKAVCSAYRLDKWFSYWKPLVEPMVEGGTALHVDLTPIPTLALFSSLNSQTKDRLRANGIGILLDLVRYLKPDYTVACISGRNFKPLEEKSGLVKHERFMDLDVWRCTWGHHGKFLWVRKTGESPVPHTKITRCEIGRWA